MSPVIAQLSPHPPELVSNLMIFGHTECTERRIPTLKRAWGLPLLLHAPSLWNPLKENHWAERSF